MKATHTVITMLIALGQASAQVPEAWKDWPPEVFDGVGPIQSTARTLGLTGSPPGAVDPIGVAGLVDTVVLSAAMRDLASPTAALPDAVRTEDRLMAARLMVGDVSGTVRAWLRTLSREELVALTVKTPRTAHDYAACDAVLAALISAHGVSDENAAGLPDIVQRRLADYYRDRRDGRCVKLYQRMLGQRTEKADKWVPELFGLAKYYRDVGRTDDAVAWFRKAASFTVDADVIADLEIEALRTLARAGQLQTAAVGYEKLLTQELLGGRSWVALGDLADLKRRMGDDAAADQIRREAREGRHGPVVKFWALRAEAGRARRSAVVAVDPDERLRGFSSTLALYRAALDALDEDQTDPQDAMTRRTEAEVMALEKYVREKVAAATAKGVLAP